MVKDLVTALCLFGVACFVHWCFWWLLAMWVVLKTFQYLKWKTAKIRFDGKVVFISGGSSGIGEQLAKDMISAGAAKVIIAARRIKELERVQSECKDPKRVQVVEMDLSNPDACEAKAKELFQSEKVDILVNNGGVSQRECFEAMEFSVAKKMMNINCVSHIGIISAALPGMIARKHGQIVNILTISGLVGNPVRTMYSASKFALSGFGRALRPEVKQHGISVHQIYPAYVRTSISANAMQGSGKTFSKLDGNIAKGIPVEECTLEIMRSLVCKQNELIIGNTYYQTVHIILALVPTFVYNFLLDRQFKSQMKVKSKAE